MKPFKLQPAFKDYLWGGTRLVSEYGKQTSLRPLAESWELSAHADGPSVIATGAHKGVPLPAWLQENPAAKGTRCPEGDFPVLFKLIDAEQALSVQVHPGEAYAQAMEGEHGKTEMWVVLEAQPDAFLYFGFAGECTREDMQTAIENGTLTQLLHRVPVQRGDVFYIPAGTLHAIGAGLLVAELQQNSNCTYRVYDYDRRDADGNPRPLHLEKALEVTNTSPAKSKAPGAGPVAERPDFTLTCLANGRLFHMHRLALRGVYTQKQDEESFTGVFCAKGQAVLAAEGESLALCKGETAFVPAGTAFTLEGKAELLLMGI